MYSDECSVGLALLREIFKELRGEGYDFQLHDGTPSANGVSAFDLPSGTRLACIRADRDSLVLTALVKKIWIQAEEHGSITGTLNGT